MSSAVNAMEHRNLRITPAEKTVLMKSRYR